MRKPESLEAAVNGFARDCPGDPVLAGGGVA
jgi:hypothetical protein